MFCFSLKLDISFPKRLFTFDFSHLHTIDITFSRESLYGCLFLTASGNSQQHLVVDDLLETVIFPFRTRLHGSTNRSYIYQHCSHRPFETFTLMFALRHDLPRTEPSESTEYLTLPPRSTGGQQVTLLCVAAP